MRLGHLSLLLFLGLIGICAVLAAPAPKDQPWVTGWDKPIDPDQDCKFVRDGDVLTIEVPGGNHDMKDIDPTPQMNAPCLLRKVEGDFVVQVRVSGNFRLKGDVEKLDVSAGLVLRLDGNDFVRFERNFHRLIAGGSVLVPGFCSSRNACQERPDDFFSTEDVNEAKSLSLRLERSGNLVRMFYREFSIRSGLN